MASPSLDDSVQTASKMQDVSLARQRRRKTTRKSLTKSLNHAELQNGDRNSIPLTQLSESLGDSLQPTLTLSTDNGKSTATSSTGAARQRRTQRKRESVRRRVVGTIEQTDFTPQSEHELEDSTAGVANLLERNLDQASGTETPQQQRDPDGEVIANPDVHSPNRQTTEAVHTYQQDNQQGDPLINEQRPLPPRLDLPIGNSTNLSLTWGTIPLSNDIFGIIIHRTDLLRASVNISHPCIRISVIDCSDEASGTYARKSNPTKCVTSYYESGNPAVDYIMPILTQPFNSTDRTKSLQPEWEETLIFNEHPTHFTENEKLVIFFEVLDFPTSTSIATRSRWQSTSLDSSPWYKIAWAFILPSGRTGKTRMGEKCRLQLFQYPKRRFRRSPETTEVHNLWSRGYRVAYPSTIYVTLKPIANGPMDSALPSPQPLRRSMLPTQREEGSVTFEQLLLRQPITNSTSNLLEAPSKLLSASARLSGQPCHIPTTNHATLYPAKMGCSSLVFSHSGRLLAAGCANQETAYPVVIFEVSSFKTLLVMEGHRGIIYSLCWTQNDQLLASASADGLVKLWSLASPTVSEPLTVLPHPCYVYSVCFSDCDQTDQLVFTGAYDNTVRVWSISSDSYKLISELRGHTGLVNCLVCSDKKILYVGDSKGQLGVWQEKQGVWQMKKHINIVNGSPLVSLSLHPSGRKILLHTEKGQLVMLDLRIDRPCCEFRGILLSQSQRCSSFISPCGGLVFAGGKGQINVWKSDTGTLQHVYTELPFTVAICAMTYHPSEHMLAISGFGSHQPLVVCTHISRKTKSEDLEANNTQIANRTDSNDGRIDVTGQDSMILHLNQRIREVTKTLNRSTTSDFGTGRTKVRKK